MGSNFMLFEIVDTIAPFQMSTGPVVLRAFLVVYHTFTDKGKDYDRGKGDDIRYSKNHFRLLVLCNRSRLSASNT